MSARPATLLHLLAGFTLWALTFVLLYALQALGCVWGWPEPTHRLILVGTWLASLAIIAVMLFRQWRRQDTPGLGMGHVGLWGTAAALAAMLATFFPVTFASLCI